MNDIVNTIEAAAPLLAATGNPEVASALSLAPVALQLLQAAQTMTKAGAMTPQQLSALWAQIGQGIMTTHNAWETLDRSGG